MTILPASPPPSVILLGGASGSGKSYLARRHGRPHLSLDAFYRPQSDDGAAGGPGPVFPRTPYGEIDWDHPGTWDEQAAVDAVVELLKEGATRVPDYDISTSSVRGHSTVALEPGGVIVAEGIFAERMPAALDRAGVRYAAWYIDQARTTTAARRFVRDVAERRKPVPFLVQRGWSLYRTDAARRAAAVAAGFTPRRKREIIADLTV
ncbi:uridine kinase [Micrococcus luteus]|uniref:uridine kinase family protein n=1 Tax=Micrococcus luteus TaxID=1270 RepID=UPI003325F729